MVPEDGFEPPMTPDFKSGRYANSLLGRSWSAWWELNPQNVQPLKLADMPVLLHADGGPGRIRTYTFPGFESGRSASCPQAHVQLFSLFIINEQSLMAEGEGLEPPAGISGGCFRNSVPCL